jgi:imidazolonepropionase-like amidohydrolase
MSTILFKNGTVFDGTGTDPQANTSLLIEDDKIKAVGPADQMDVPPDAEVVDVTGKFVMPGMFNNHSHLGWDGARDLEVQSTEDTDAVTAGVVVMNMRRSLEAGLTNVRDLGMNEAGFLAKDFQERGLAVGPRLYLAGKAICTTGGHTWWCCREADSPYGVRQAVREQFKRGAVLIKIMASGRHPEFTVEELKAAADEVHNFDRKITAHATIPQAVDNVLDAGFDCIEHGADFSDEQIERMLENDVFVVTTLSPGYLQAEHGMKYGMTEAQVMARRERLKNPTRALRTGEAGRAGVTLAFGTDAGSPAVPHNNIADEFRLLLEVGVVDSMKDALLMATRNSAELNDVLDTLGTLEPGKLADVVVIDGDPMADPMDMANVERVYLGGERMV